MIGVLAEARLSKRLARLAATPDGWAVFSRARQMEAAGERVINLTIGDHDDPTPAPILDAMDTSARGGNTGYAPVPGSDALRRAIAARVARQTGVETEPSNVLVTAGGQAALFSAIMCTTDPGDRVAYLDPYYATYPGTIAATGAVGIAVPCDPATGFRPRLAELAAAAGRASALLINTPNNPTGAVYGRQTLVDIAETAAGAWIISDEVYDGQVWDGTHLSPRALADVTPRTLVVGSLSKSHKMTGARLGWLVGPEHVIAAATALAVNTTYGIPGFIQDAGKAALSLTTVEAGVAALYRRRRDAALDVLSRTNAVQPVAPEGGMYVMLDVRGTGLTGEAFADRLLDRHQIAVMPGESFGRAAAGHVRIALTRPEAELRTALTTLIAMAEDP